MCWTIDQCVAVKKSGLRCKNKPIHNKDFCKCHSNEHVYDTKIMKQYRKEQNQSEIDKLSDKYLDLVMEKFCVKLVNNIRELDKNYSHCLFGIYNSWKEIPFIYWIFIDNMWWDIQMLNKTFSSQLNQTELEKPYPTYLENPFTRNKISISDIKKIRDFNDALKTHTNIKINIALDTFTHMSNKILNDIKNTKQQYELSGKIIKQFSKVLRFRMINYRDSQNRYCGYWVNKKEQLSKFEKCYDEIVTATLFVDNFFVLIDSPAYRKIVMALSNLRQEEYDI
jgi:hypothetical protein